MNLDYTRRTLGRYANSKRNEQLVDALCDVAEAAVAISESHSRMEMITQAKYDDLSESIKKLKEIEECD